MDNPISNTYKIHISIYKAKKNLTRGKETNFLDEENLVTCTHW